jgi:Acyl-CoA carboxylase epsilon subunit
MSEEVVSAATEIHDPVIKVVRGRPTDEEVAALVTVLAAAAGGGEVDAGPVTRDLWGHPVDRLRYSIFSWQRVTQVERVHVRR